MLASPVGPRSSGHPLGTGNIKASVESSHGVCRVVAGPGRALPGEAGPCPGRALRGRAALPAGPRVGRLRFRFHFPAGAEAGAGPGLQSRGGRGR